MDSFLSWIGGKKALRHVIVECFPTEYNRYIEVFGGAGWVFFYKKPEPFEVYNDFNSNLTNMMLCAKEQTLEFLDELGFLPLNGREEFDRLKAFMANKQYVPNYRNEMALAKKHLPELECKEMEELFTYKTALGNVKRAVMFYKLIRYSYAAGTTSYSCQPMDVAQVFDQIRRANRRLNNSGPFDYEAAFYHRPIDAGQGVIVENKDFEALIRHYDRVESFFYCDPPYYGTEGYYENMFFAKEDHIRLRDTLLEIKGRFLLSYNDCDFIRELYDGCHINSCSRISNISQRYNPGGEYKEVLIANYDVNQKKGKMQQLSVF